MPFEDTNGINIEPLTGESMNLRNDKQDGQSDRDGQTSVQEDQNLQDAYEIGKSIIHEFVNEDHLSELWEIKCSDRKSEHTSVTAEEIIALDLFEEEEIAQTEFIVEATETEQTISVANLLIAESGKGKHDDSDTAAVQLGPALKSPGMMFLCLSLSLSLNFYCLGVLAWFSTTAISFTVSP